MRIRKRSLSLSAATPPPSSDPRGLDHHQPPLLVQQQVHPNWNLRVPHDDGTHSQPLDPPLPSSDHTKQIGLPPSTWVSSGAGSEPKQPIVFTHKELEGEREREIINSNYTGRKERIFGAEASNSVGSTSLPPPLTTAHLVLKGWLEGDRLIPIKKRRGSFVKRVNHDSEEENEMIEGKTKLEIDGKTVVTQEVSATNVKNKKIKKNVKRGNVIMEGSRCSRVNGRGWRCCQQTLVGYSLCEHHLGKGRVRSLTSVRGRAQKVAPKQQKVKGKEEGEDEMILTDYHELHDDDDDDEYVDLECAKKMSKRKKLGMVKARSLSSLLGKIGS